MLHVNVEELMKQGHSPEEIVKMIADEIYTKAEQQEEEKKKKEEEEAKKAAEKEIKAKKEVARKEAIAAAASYYALVYPNFSIENVEDFAKTAIDSVAKSMDILKTFNDITITYNGKPFSIFDL